MPPSAGATERVFYLSWVDKRTDPWPNHEQIRAPTAAASLDGRAVEFLAPEHSDWPGMPWVRGVRPPVLSDGRMGQYAWPGVPLADGSGRVYLGPTLSALLHPRSHANLKKVRRAFLLYRPEAPDGPPDLLRQTLTAVAQARGVRNVPERVQFAPVPGVADPTDFPVLIGAVRTWLALRDPFELKDEEKGAAPRRVLVNLSAGTQAMAASWLILYWSGALGDARCQVEFVQGDGGRNAAAPDNPSYDPLRTVPVEVLALVKPERPSPEPLAAPTPPAAARPAAADPVGAADGLKIDAEGLAGRPYDKVRRELEQAAFVGMPVVLEGARGTGKTFLAEFYHQRRRVYEEADAARRGEAAPVAKAAGARRKGKAPRPACRPPLNTEGGRLVKVTLSEFADLENLRNALLGWAAKSFTGAGDEDNDGLLGEAHGGTLFLDELHHLPRELQKLLLAPLNFDFREPMRYRPMGAAYEVASAFSLVAATNDPAWKSKLIPDLRDRIARIVLQVPCFRDFQQEAPEIIWKCWETTLGALREGRGVEDPQADEWPSCRRRLDEFFRTDPLPGNWRDLQTLAAYVVFLMTEARGGRPMAGLHWSEEQLNEAIRRTVANRPSDGP